MALTEMAGADPLDMTTYPSAEDFRSYLSEEPRGLTVGIAEETDGCAESVVRAVKRAGEKLERLGGNVVPVTMPLEMALEIYLIVASAEASSNLARYDGLRFGLHGEGATAADKMRDARTRGFGDEVKRRIVTGTYALSSTYGGGYYRKVKAAQNSVCLRTEEILGRYDAVLMPTASGSAFRLGSFADDPGALYRSDRFTTIANLTGCPAVQIPGGGDGSMPVGISLMGKKRSEGALIRLAAALERELEDDVRREVGAYGDVGERYVRPLG